MANIEYLTRGATRNKPLSPELIRVYQQAAEAAGIDTIRVISAGQPAKGSGGARVGSTRHDLGQSGDIQLVRGGHVLDMRNAADQAVLAAFVQAAASGGAKGIGAGLDYMGPNTMHVGFGTPAVWGAEGKGANTPQWLRDAYMGSWTPPGPGAGPGSEAYRPPAAPLPPQAPVSRLRPPNFDPRSGGSKFAYEPFNEVTGRGSYVNSRGQTISFNRAGNTIYGGRRAPQVPVAGEPAPTPPQRPVSPPTPALRPYRDSRVKDDKVTLPPSRTFAADIGRDISDFRSEMLGLGTPDSPILSSIVNAFGAARATRNFTRGPFGFLGRLFGS